MREKNWQKRRKRKLKNEGECGERNKQKIRKDTKIYSTLGLYDDKVCFVTEIFCFMT